MKQNNAFHSNHIGEIAKMHKFGPPPENMSALKSAIKGGMKSKEMHSYFVCFVEKMPAPLARMRIYRWRHALLTRLSTSYVLTGLQ